MTNSTLQEIKGRLDVAEVIGGYIPIKKSGVNFKAVCPFHSEKTPSLMISPSKQIWHCFGCGEGGDVFGFVTRFENLEFKEALKILAEKAGVQLNTFRPLDQKEEDEKGLLLRINDFAARLFHQVLIKEQDGKNALEYLKRRGLNLETIKKWQIGFSPNDFHFLHKALQKKGLSEDLAVRAGVCVRNEKGNTYDRFRGRVTFPIYNYFGEIVGFSARILLDDGKSAKYINSPETLVYKKSETLFGLNFAKDLIRKKDEMVIVEGQMDCISLHQAGFTNVVAASGTAYNEQAAGFTKARRLSKNIKFCFDADSAGRMALRRAGGMLLRQGFRIKVIELKSAKDPDELVKKSPGLWAKAVSEAVWFLDYYINLAKENFEKDIVAQKHYLSEEVVPLIKFIEDPLEKDHYINELINKFGVSERVIKGQTAGSAPLKKNNTTGRINNHELFFGLEKEILGGIILYPDFANLALGLLAGGDFESYEVKKILEEALASKQAVQIDKNSSLAKEAVFMVESRLEEFSGDREVLIKQLTSSLRGLKLRSLKRQQNELLMNIKEAEEKGDRGLLGTLNIEFAEISRLRVKLEKGI